ncbi:hypothetical protein, partial [Aureimonas ureilytica]
FTTPDQLKGFITRAIHEWQLANAAGPIDPHEMLVRAQAHLPENRGRGYMRGNGPVLALSLACGPQQNILRPAEIESPQLVEDLKRTALFGPVQIFNPERGTSHRLDGDGLLITQGDEAGSVRLGPGGDLLFRLPLATGRMGMVVIEEDVREEVSRAVAFANAALDRIDPTQRLTHIAPVLTFPETDHLVWRDRAEQQASPDSYSMGGFGRPEPGPVHLNPAIRPRAALALDGGHMVEDLIVLLRRAWKAG